MPRWLKRQWNDHGEWSIADLRMGYRICAYNHGIHEGVHLHDLATGAVLQDVPVATLAEAEAVVRRYHAEHDRFDPDAFREVVRRWRSESRRR